MSDLCLRSWGSTTAVGIVHIHIASFPAKLTSDTGRIPEIGERHSHGRASSEMLQCCGSKARLMRPYIRHHLICEAECTMPSYKTLLCWTLDIRLPPQCGPLCSLSFSLSP